MSTVPEEGGSPVAHRKAEVVRRAPKNLEQCEDPGQGGASESPRWPEAPRGSWPCAAGGCPGVQSRRQSSFRPAWRGVRRASCSGPASAVSFLDSQPLLGVHARRPPAVFVEKSHPPPCQGAPGVLDLPCFLFQPLELVASAPEMRKTRAQGRLRKCGKGVLACESVWGQKDLAGPPGRTCGQADRP